MVPGNGVGGDIFWPASYRFHGQYVVGIGIVHAQTWIFEPERGRRRCVYETFEPVVEPIVGKMLALGDHPSGVANLFSIGSKVGVDIFGRFAVVDNKQHHGATGHDNLTGHVPALQLFSQELQIVFDLIWSHGDRFSLSSPFITRLTESPS